MMIPIQLIQALFKSVAVQQPHSLLNASHGEENSLHSSTNLSRRLSDATTEIPKNTIQHIPLHQVDTIDLTSNDSNQFLQQEFSLLTQGDRNISLRMSGRKENGKIDSDFCRLLFSLELENLNEVVIDVKVQKRILSIVIFNQTEEIESVVSEMKSTLQKNLEPLGYQLSSVKIGNPKESHKEIESDLTRGNERVDVKI